MVAKKPKKTKEAKLQKSPQEFLASFLHPDDMAFIKEHRRDFIGHLKGVAVNTPPSLRNKTQKTSICLGPLVLNGEPNYEFFNMRIDIQEEILKELKQDWGLIEDFSITDSLKSILKNGGMPEEMLWAVINFYPDRFLTNIKEVSTTSPQKQSAVEKYYNPKDNSLFFDGKTYTPRKETQAKFVRNLIMKHQTENNKERILKPGERVSENTLATEIGITVKKLRAIKKQLSRTFKESFPLRLRINSNSEGILLVLTE